MSGDQNAGRSQVQRLITIPLKGWKISNIWEQPLQIKILFKKKLRAEVRECLLSFGAESLVFQFAIQKFKD